MVVNTHRTWTRASWGACAAGAAMALAPWAFDIDPGSGGGALLFVGILVGATGLGCALVFRRDADKLDALAAGHGLLARWSFSPGEWSKFRAREELEESAAKRGLAALVTLIALAIGVPFAFSVREGGLAVLGVLALVCGLCWALALYLPAHRLAPTDDARDVEVLIGRDGVYLPGEFHCWTSFGARFADARVRTGRHPVVELEYRLYHRHGWNTYEVRVPIPAGALDEAERVCNVLMDARGRARSRAGEGGRAMRSPLVLLLLCCLPIIQSCGTTGESPPAGTTPIAQLIAANRSPVEVLAFGPDGNLVVRRFRLTLKNVCDKQVKLVTWTQLFFDAKGLLLTGPKREGGFAELGGIAPGETYEGVAIVPDNAARGRIVIRAVTYESAPPGADTNPSLRMYKLNYQWKNPDHDAAVQAITTSI